MKSFTCQFMFLEPKRLEIRAVNPKSAAEIFLTSNGGLGKGNYGRCVTVKSADGKESHWAFIRDSMTSGHVAEIDEQGHEVK